MEFLIFNPDTMDFNCRCRVYLNLYLESKKDFYTRARISATNILDVETSLKITVITKLIL